MHGWSDDALVFGDDMLSRFADYGLFVAAIGLRGRNSADGARDASGREIYDIIDAITYIRTNYASIVDSEKVCIVGYSGGGGNALAAACKFPDMFNVVVDFFGMSDYGRDGTNGWYYNNSGTHTAVLLPNCRIIIMRVMPQLRFIILLAAICICTINQTIRLCLWFTQRA